MTIHFECHGCGSDFHVPDALAGTSARCNRCGAVVTVPVPRMSFARMSGEQQYDPRAGGSFDPYQFAGKPATMGKDDAEGMPPRMWTLMGVGGGVALLVIAALVVRALFFRGDATPVPPLASNNAGQTVASAKSSNPTTSGTGARGDSTPANMTTAPALSLNPPRTLTPASAPAGETFSTAHDSTAARPDQFKSSDVSPRGESEDEASNRFMVDTAHDGTASSNSSGDSSSNNSSSGDSSSSDWADRDASVAWGDGGGEVRIPVDDDKAVTFGPLGRPMVVVGQDVWNLTTNRLVQSLEGEYEQRGLTALSADGQWFAAALQSPNQPDTEVGVWSTATGKKAFTIPGDVDHYVDVLTFTRDKYLIVAGRDSGDVFVWDVETGQQARTVPYPGAKVEKGKIAFTADGQYFAAVAEKQLVVMKTANGKPAALMNSPLSMEREFKGNAVAMNGGKAPTDNRRADPSSAAFVYARLKDLEFSPDSQELAGLSAHPRPRLLCWDHRGKVILDEPLDQLPSLAFGEHQLQWLPDKSGWVMNGNVYDRASRRVVLGVRKVYGAELRVHAIDRARLIGVFPRNPAELRVIQIPWEGIRKSLAAMHDDVPAHLGPGTPVSLHIELAGLRGDQHQQETVRQIGDAMVARLARDGVKVERGRPTTFHVKFAEKAGDQVAIYSRQSPFDFRGHDTGRRATEAQGELVIELIIEGESQPLWRDTINAGNSSSFREEITDASIRKSMLENLARRINELNFPYFIPQSEDLLALPVVLD